jgi:hypothetical protein
MVERPRSPAVRAADHHGGRAARDRTRVPYRQWEAGTRFDEHLDGRISPGTGKLAGRYEIVSTDPLPAGPAGPADDRSGWAGMSGAAVFSGELLLGVIGRDRRASAGTRLAATPVQNVLAVAEARELIKAHAGRVPVVEAAELTGLLESAVARVDLRSPAMLLRADAEVVGFRGRRAEQGQLMNWCLNGGGVLSVRVLTGPGGQGKTRLARWLIDAIRERGWPAGQLRTDLPDDHAVLAAHVSRLAEVSDPVLLVADYAESRPQLIRQIIAAASEATSPVRLLLVARSSGPWQTAPLGAPAAVHEILAAAPEIPLGSLDATAAGRAQGFTIAALALARGLGRIEGFGHTDWPALIPALKQPAQLGGSRYQTALSVQMAALVELLQNGPAPVSAGAAEPVEAILLRHEERYWDRTALADHLDAVPPVLLRRAVGAACLCGAADEGQAVDTLTRLAGVTAERALAMALWLGQLYPAPAGQYWGSLQPDRVAEYHAAAMVTGTAGLLTALLTGAAPDQQVQAVTVLARAAVAHTNADRAAAAAQVLNVLNAALRKVDPALPVLQASHAALPYSGRALATFTVGLAEDVAALYRRLATVDPGAYDADLATALNNLAIDYGGVGRAAEALTAAREALAIRHRLYAADPDTQAADLAADLTTFAHGCEGVGRYQEGLDAIEEAVAIRRRLEAASPEVYLAELASSLSFLATLDGYVGDRTNALRVAGEAVAIRRRLAAADPDAFSYDLSESLNNLAVSRSEMGLLAESVDAIQEAAAITRRLAEANPDAYEASLATTLNNLAIRYSDVERFAAGLAAAQEATAIRRRLAAANPGAYTQDLAESLTTLANLHEDLRQPAKGLAPAKEAVAIFRRLAADNPGAYLSHLATALTNLANLYGDASQPVDRLATAEEALAIWRQLAAASPEGHQPDVALSLNNLSIAYGDAGRGKDALAAAKESVAIRRPLAAASPGEHQPGLASSLNNLSVRYSLTGHPAEALTAGEEASRIWRKLASDQHSSYDDDLAIALYNLSYRYAEAGRTAEGVAAAEEAVSVRRQQAARDPEFWQPDLAMALDALALRYQEAKRHADRQAATEQASELRRQL